MKLGPKLIGAFVMVSVLSLVVGVTGWSQITSVNNELNDITAEKVPAMDSSMEMGIAVWGQRDAAAAYMLGDSDAKTDFQTFKEEFETFETELRASYPNTQEIDDASNAHDTFSDYAENPTTGLFTRIDEKNQAIADSKQAMSDFDAAAEEMITNLEDLEDMQVTRKETAQTAYSNAISAADASMEMKIAVRQQQIAADGYLLGKDTYNDFVTNEGLFGAEYNNLINVMNTAGAQHADDMHANFITFFYGGNLPHTVTLTMEDGTQETFTVGQIVIGAKPAYDNMILSEQAALQAMANFDEAAALLQTGNIQGIKEDEVGGDDNLGLDGSEEYSEELGEFGEISMDAMIVLNKLRDTAAEYLLESESLNLPGIEQGFETLAVELDKILYNMDILAEKIDGTTVNSPTNKFLMEVRHVRDLYGQFLDWATDSTISGITYTTVGTSNLGMFDQHDIELQKYIEYGQKMEDTDAAGTLLFAKIDTNATLSTNATLRDLIWEQLMTVNDYTITGEAAEKAAFTTISNQIQALPYYSEFQTEHQAVITEGTACIDAYDAWVAARDNMRIAMDQFDIMGDMIEYGDSDYLTLDTTYNWEGPTDPASTVNPAAVGDNKGLDYLEWRGDVYGLVEVTSLHLSFYLKEQQDIAGEYLLEGDITGLSSVESEFMDSAETFDNYHEDLSTFSSWFSDDAVLSAFESEIQINHGNFLDLATDTDWLWTVADETDSDQDGMFTAHYDDLLGDQQMMDQLEDFDAMANEIATELENLEATVETTMQQSETELNLAFDAADHAMELKTLLVQQMDTAAEYLLEDNESQLPPIENEFNSLSGEFDTLTSNLTALVDDGLMTKNSEEALVSDVISGHEQFLDYATDDISIDSNQQNNGMFEAHDDKLSSIASADSAMADLDAEAESLENDLAEIESATAVAMGKAQTRADDAVSMAITMIFSIAAIAVIVGIVLGTFISRSISKPVTELAEGSKSLAEGDFNVKLDVKASKDEIGDMVTAYQGMLDNTAIPLAELNTVSQAIAKGDLSKDINIKAKGQIDEIVRSFNQMQDNLRNLVSEIQETSSAVAATSQELASSSEEMNASTQQVSSAIQQISKGSQSQATQVEETAKIMEQMSQSVEDVTSRAQSATESASRTTSTADEGRKAVLDAVNKMRSIQIVVNDSAKTIENLGKRSEEIGQIVDVITGITDQTNLLALNAAIEAARAGEQGRGFAVVAEEVKNLAEDSREAADRIANMIKEIQGETGKAVDGMQRGTKEVEEGMIAVETTDKSFGEITKMAAISAEDILAISEATTLQKTGTERVAKSVDGIASVAEESASASEESASSTEELTASMEEMTARAQELSEMAIALQKSASRFSLGDSETTQMSKPKELKKKGKHFPEAGAKREFSKGRKKAGSQVKLPPKVNESLKKRGLIKKGGK
jgi:methyl-accepting chemotaxis protein